MKKSYLLRLSRILLMWSLWACGNTSEKSHDANEAMNLSSDIKSLEEKFTATMPNADTAIAADLISNMLRYADLFPDDTLSAIYRIKSANLYIMFPDKETEALRQLQIVFTRFAGQPYAAQALFLSGLIYDNNLRQPLQAVRMWERVVNEYPNHVLAGQAASLLKITDDDPYNDLEIIERWLKDPKNKTQESAQKN